METEKFGSGTVLGLQSWSAGSGNACTAMPYSRDNRDDRRARAWRLTMQGRAAEAFIIDRRLGL